MYRVFWVVAFLATEGRERHPHSNALESAAAKYTAEPVLQ